MQQVEAPLQPVTRRHEARLQKTPLHVERDVLIPFAGQALRHEPRLPHRPQRQVLAAQVFHELTHPLGIAEGTQGADLQRALPEQALAHPAVEIKLPAVRRLPDFLIEQGVDERPEHHLSTRLIG